MIMDTLLSIAGIDGPYAGLVDQVRRDKQDQPKFLSMQHRIFVRAD